jgi:hypothetical protein
MMQPSPAGGHMVQPQYVAQQPQYVAQQVQYMAQQPTTVTVQQQPVTLARPDDCLGCSIFTCLFCNAFFLGISLICLNCLMKLGIANKRLYSKGSISIKVNLLYKQFYVMSLITQTCGVYKAACPEGGYL